MANRLELTQRGDREVVIVRAFDAARDLVFAAYTQERFVRRWLLGPPGWTMPVCEVDLREGGGYHYVWENAEGSRFALKGRFTEIAAPVRLVSIESFDDDWTGGPTEVAVTFAQDGPERTIVTQAILYASAEARAGALGTGMAEGMGMGFDRLESLLPEFAAEHAG